MFWDQHLAFIPLLSPQRETKDITNQARRVLYFSTVDEIQYFERYFYLLLKLKRFEKLKLKKSLEEAENKSKF